MDDSKTIVLKDNCDDSVIGVITVNGKDKEDVENNVNKVYEIFNDIMQRLEGSWSIEDLMEGLSESDLSYSWSTDFIVKYI